MQIVSIKYHFELKNEVLMQILHWKDEAIKILSTE